MKRLLTLVSNSKGSTIIQVMLASTVILGVSGYMMRSHQTQNKLQKGLGLKKSQTIIQREVAEALADGTACYNTFEKLKPLANNATFVALYNKDNQIMYNQNSFFNLNKIKEFRLTNYVPSSGKKYQRVILNLTVETEAESSGFFGGKSRTYEIPLFLITVDNLVDVCVSDISGQVVLGLKAACEELGGTFNDATAGCDNFHGPNGVVLNYIRDYLCSSSGTGCAHPYRNQACSGKDIRGVDHGNWVVKGFKANGQMDCLCVPVECPEPGQFCQGTDLGTDWCTNECQKGTKADGFCVF